MLAMLRLLLGLCGMVGSSQSSASALDGMRLNDPSFVIKVHSELESFEKTAPDLVASAGAADRARAFLQHTMTGANGARFECFVPHPMAKPPPSAEVHAEAEGGDEADDEGKDGDGDEDSVTAAGAAQSLRALQGKCAQLRLGFWWYEVCPFASATQFHMEGNKRTTIIQLGKYDAGGDELQDVLAKGAKGSSLTIEGEIPVMLGLDPKGSAPSDWKWSKLPATAYVQKYVSGDDERALLARWSCGPSNALKAVVEEPVHVYTARLESPLLCPRASASSVLEQLQGVCVRKAEGWWSFEFCFGDKVRQFHRESDGSVKQQHVLGRYDAETIREAEAASGGGGVTSTTLQGSAGVERTVKVLTHRYGNGDQCDLTKRPRFVDVLHHCAAGHAPHIASVREVRSCEYELTVAVPALCGHPSMGAAPPGEDGDGGDGNDSTAENGAQAIHCLAQAEWRRFEQQRADKA